jgi:hypothetical protein
LTVQSRCEIESALDSQSSQKESEGLLTVIGNNPDSKAYDGEEVDGLNAENHVPWMEAKGAVMR